MTMREPGRQPASDPFMLDGAAAELGLASPLDYVQLVRGAVRRRWVLASSVFLIVLVAAGTYYRLRPASYRVEAKILSQLPPEMMRAGMSDLPARSAWELIHRRENLVALAEESGLLAPNAIHAERGVVTRVLEFVRPPEGGAKEEPLDLLVRILDRRLMVTTEEGTIEIRLDWPNPRQGYQLVQAAVQSFLEARHLQEVTSIDEVIAKMEGRTSRLKADLDAAMAAAHRRTPSGPVRAAAPRARVPSEELVRLRSLLDAKTRATRDVEEFRSRRLAELEAQLTQARATLSEAHPTVVTLRADIEALSHESSQLRALREEERKARAEYSALATREGAAVDPVGTEQPPAIGGAGAEADEDPRVRDLRLQYEQMVSRLAVSRGELDAARAAFKYRYNVIWPPEIPTKPYSPDPLKVLGGGFAAAILLGLLAAVLPDVLSGRIVEAWQVERQLNLTVLGETSPSQHSPK